MKSSEYQELTLRKLSKIDETVVGTRIKVAKVEEHLRALNGRVCMNTKDIKEIFRSNYKLIGGLGVVITIITIAINRFF